jgi:hypothetical protein
LEEKVGVLAARRGRSAVHCSKWLTGRRLDISVTTPPSLTLTKASQGGFVSATNVLKHARRLTMDPRPLLGKTSMLSNDAL